MEFFWLRNEAVYLFSEQATKLEERNREQIRPLFTLLAQYMLLLQHIHSPI